MQNIDFNNNLRVLYKGKIKDSDKWVEGYVWNGASHSYIIPYNVGINYDLDTYRLTAFAKEVVPETVILFTNKDDKNGRHIFVGDVVVYDNENYVVIFDEYCRFVITNGKQNNLLLADKNKDVVVIGSVYDNPELLNKETETTEKNDVTVEPFSSKETSKVKTTRCHFNDYYDEKGLETVLNEVGYENVLKILCVSPDHSNGEVLYTIIYKA